MDRPSNTLTRYTTGLLPAHTALIKLLAQIAVEDYLSETEAAETAPEAPR